MAAHHANNITPAFPGLPTEMVLKILENLDDRSLLFCRLVSKSWCEASSKILQSRTTIIVVVQPDSWRRHFSLASFINCIKQCREFGHLFPCNNFEFKEDDLNKIPDLELFFNLSKQSNSCLNVECLRLNSANFFQDNLKNIFDGASNLRILCLPFVDENQLLGDVATPNLENIYGTLLEGSLPSLEVLQLDNCKGATAIELVSNILKVASNLQRIEGDGYAGFKGGPYCVHELDHLHVLVDSKKLYLVNKCNIFFSEELVSSGLLVREKLSGFQPAYLNLFCPGLEPDSTSDRVRNLEQNISALREVFWTVKDGVQELEIDIRFSLQDKLKVPRFSKLKQLTLNLGIVSASIFPAGVGNGDLFPKLEKISFVRSVPMDEGEICPSLSHIPEILSVRILELEVDSSIEKTFLESMAIMCPNLQSFKLAEDLNWSDFIWLGPAIWEKMRGLKILTLNSKLPLRIDDLKKIEAAFTGFSLDTVRGLEAAAPEDWPTLEEVEHLRINPSILNMTELKKLKINLRLVNREGPDPVFPLSFRYAFQLMPGLTVDISSTRNFDNEDDNDLHLLLENDLV